MSGVIVSRNSLTARDKFYCLVIDCGDSQRKDAISVGKPIAEELLKVWPKMRSFQMEKCILNVLNKLPDNSVIKDIDVLFNPSYSVDVLRVLISVYKQRAFSVVWPGICKDGYLIYAEEGYPDYKTFTVSDYNIVCIV